MACEIYAIEFVQIDLFMDMQKDRLKNKENFVKEENWGESGEKKKKHENEYLLCLEYHLVCRQPLLQL